MQILGSGMSAKMWEATVEHARTCVLTEQLHIYYHPDGENKSGVVFNVVGEVMGLVCDQRFLPIRDLEDKEKVQETSLCPDHVDYSDSDNNNSFLFFFFDS